MNCELIFVGTELLLGDILNTNAQYLSRRLAALGINVLSQRTIGDNAQRLTAALSQAFEVNDIVITTGGLGPTADDITKEVCAEFFSIPLEMDNESLESIESYFKNKGIPMPESNKKQAMLPAGCKIIENKNGTAPGCIMEKNGKTIIVLPGPPREMKPMFESVEPYLRQFSGAVIKSSVVRTFGIGESLMAQKVRDLLDLENPTVAPYAKGDQAHLRVTARAKDENQAMSLIRPVVEQIKSRLNGFVYGVDVDSIEQVTVNALAKAGKTVATAESCTAGLIAKRLTDIPGSSKVVRGGFVTYTNEMKTDILGVDPDIIEKYSAVSEETAVQMALGAKQKAKADVAVSVTGLAGPDSDESSKPVGLIYIAVTDGKKTKVKRLLTGHSTGDCRDYNRMLAASNAINEVRMFVNEL